MYQQDLEFEIINLNKDHASKLYNFIDFESKQTSINNLKKYSKENNLNLIYNICNNLCNIDYNIFLSQLESYILKWW